MENKIMSNKNVEGQPDIEMPVDAPTIVPTPPVDTPTVPVLPAVSPDTRSDYPDKRGSAAAADPPTPAVATQGKKEETILKMRGVPEARTRSPTPR